MPTRRYADAFVPPCPLNDTCFIAHEGATPPDSFVVHGDTAPEWQQIRMAMSSQFGLHPLNRWHGMAGLRYGCIGTKEVGNDL